MAGRIRSIKPEILEDEKTAAMSSAAWRLWVSMWLLADDHGRLRGSSVWLRGQVFWHENHASEDVARLLEELANARVIRRYEVDGQKYIEVRSWKKHQKVDHPSAPRIPLPPPDDTEESTDLAKTSRDIREPLAPDLRSGSGSPIRTRTTAGCDWRKLQDDWLAATGNIGANGLSEVGRCCEDYAPLAGTDPNEYARRAFGKFVEWSKGCPPAKRPPLSPQKFVEHVVRIHEMVMGKRNPVETEEGSADSRPRPKLFEKRYADGEP